MEREAQAMAKLSHPNVVTVYEVGEHKGQLYLAMEFVRGRDLRVWLREGAGRLSWRAVLAAFVQAGEGLAAAHRAGLIHRDFKPDNVFVGDDERVRVGDFGLARRELVDDELSTTSPGEGAERSALTATGVLMGTPAFIAPEQFAGAAVDARADQFSFCVALWDALYGQRAFAGETLAALVLNVTGGVRVPPPADSRVPTWVRRMLDRGLSREPGDRWPTMDALLAALRADPTRRRRWWAGAAAVGLAIGGWFGGQAYEEARRTDECAAEGASIAEVWNDEAEATLRAALLGTGVSYAATTADRVVPYFAAHADAWQRARAEACLDARVRGVWDEETYERSVWCLDNQRVVLAETLARLSRGDPTSVPQAVRLPKRAKPVIYTEEEAERLIEAARAAGGDALAFVLLLLHAGLRSSEVRALRWGDIDLRKGIVTVQHNYSDGEEVTPKSGEAAPVGLSPGLADVLRALPRGSKNDHVFLRVVRQGREKGLLKYHTPNTITYKLNKLQEAAGLETSGPHRLRHTGLTILASKGTNPYKLQKHARHSKLETTQGYVHLAAEQAAREVAAMWGDARAPNLPQMTQNGGNAATLAN